MTKALLRISVTMASRLPNPISGFSKILRHAVTNFIHQADFVCGLGIALVSRFFVPNHCLGIVLGHPRPSRTVHGPETELSLRVALVGGLLQIIRNLGLGDAD
jgi:hypothetical protein